jgi:hypothetical protein
MGPFPDGSGGHFDLNSSNLIARMLPDHLEIQHTTSALVEKQNIRINIMNPTAATPTSYVLTEYGYVRHYVRELYARYFDGPAKASTPDLIIHLGQGPPELWIERFSFSQSMRSTWWSDLESERGYYRIPDKIGQTIDDIDDGNDVWAEQNVPAGLSTSMNVDALHAGALRYQAIDRARWQSLGSAGALVDTKPGHEIRLVTHHEPGSYLCGFIFHESLANCYVRKIRPDVMFCHVPRVLEHDEVKRGVDAVSYVIMGAVESMLDREKEEDKSKSS